MRKLQMPSQMCLRVHAEAENAFTNVFTGPCGKLEMLLVGRHIYEIDVATQCLIYFLDVSSTHLC